MSDLGLENLFVVLSDLSQSGVSLDKKLLHVAGGRDDLLDTVIDLDGGIQESLDQEHIHPQYILGSSLDNVVVESFVMLHQQIPQLQLDALVSQSDGLVLGLKLTVHGRELVLGISQSCFSHKDLMV